MPSLSTSSTILAALIGYLLVCHLLRYRRRNQKHEYYPYKTQNDFARMTVQHAYEIIRYLSAGEFPFTYDKSLEFALFKTYGIPSISSLLVKTGQLADGRNAPRRYCDTAVLLREFIQNPPNSKRALAAIARMNWLHARYKKHISNDDLLYTLGLFACEPEIWVRKYEWREFTPMEVCALGTFWKSVGDAMQISYTSLPSGPANFTNGRHWFNEIDQWCREYEKRYMVPQDSNVKVAAETVEILLWFVPRALHPFGKQAVAVLMDERLRKAMEFEMPPTWISNLVLTTLALRKLALRHLSLPRPWILRQRTITDTPDSHGRYFLLYWVTEPHYVKATLWNRFGPKALYIRLLGKPAPQPGACMADGYLTEEVGPENLKGKGLEEQQRIVEGLANSDRSGCPFSQN